MTAGSLGTAVKVVPATIFRPILLSARLKSGNSERDSLGLQLGAQGALVHRQLGVLSASGACTTLPNSIPAYTGCPNIG